MAEVTIICTQSCGLDGAAAVPTAQARMAMTLMMIMAANVWTKKDDAGLLQQLYTGLCLVCCYCHPYVRLVYR